VYFVAILHFFSIAVDSDHHSSPKKDKPVEDIIAVGLSLIGTAYFFRI